MDHFDYQQQQLHAEEVSIEAIAQEVGTPFFCYSTATLVRHYHVFADAFKDVKATICYAIKANGNLAVLKTLANEGCGGDVVSEGEIRRALAAGIPASKIVFSGVGKTGNEMHYALSQGIMQFNVESLPELELLNEVAGSLGVKAPIAIRVNPDVDSNTHDKISTGRKEDKFGIPWERARDIYASAAALEHIHVRGISTHIGSQITELKPFKEAFGRIEALVHILREEGHDISRLDLGGGLAIPYDDENPPSPAHYAQMTIEATKHLGCELVFEPGRLIVGNAGIMVSKVIYTKDSEGRRFLIVDAGMNDLIRPSFYDAYHEIIPVKAAADGTELQAMDVVGPVCETGDTFAKERKLPPLKAGDLVAFRSCGAYGAVMSNTYNARRLIPEVLVRGNEFAVIRPRETYEEMLAKDRIPGWM